jgi:hypothetical protein
MYRDIEDLVPVNRIRYVPGTVPGRIPVGFERVTQWWETDDQYTGPSFMETEG